MKRLALSAALLSLGCGDDVERRPLAERGAAIARDPASARSQYNRYACVTCHAERPRDVGQRLLPGAVLEGAARRPTFWGGETAHLDEAVARCWTLFMRGDAADLAGPTGDALAAWLWSLAPDGSTTGTGAVAHTWPPTAVDLGATGDAARGLAVWGRACASCHGAFGTGQGRLSDLVSQLPGDTVSEHCSDVLAPGRDRQEYVRTIVYEKTRHGSFLGYAGVMPPFSFEALSDADLRDIVAMFRCP